MSQRPGQYLGGDAPSGTGAIRSALAEWAWSITDAAVVITRVSVVVLIHPVRHDTRKVLGLLKSGQLPLQRALGWPWGAVESASRLPEAEFRRRVGQFV